MASCGRHTTLESKKNGKNKDWSDEDLGRDNICDFPSWAGELYSSQKDVLIIRADCSKNDNRVQIVLKKEEFHSQSYFMLCQIVTKLRGGKVAAGTGTCRVIPKHGVFLTCAHNLQMFSLRRKNLVPYKNLKVYRARQGKDSYLISGKVDHNEIITHPKYDGNPACGFDIGMFALGKFKSGKSDYNTLGSMNSVKNDVIRHYASPQKLKRGMSVEIVGYPIEKGGHPYTLKGKIETTTKTALGGHLIWYNVDLTVCNSGSCIMVTDKTFVKSVTKNPAIKKVLIGVHAGQDDVVGLNYGTLITKSLHDWIENNYKHSGPRSISL